jgi:hypothetical protein
MPRRHMRCFFQARDAAAYVASDQNPADPFHVDEIGAFGIPAKAFIDELKALGSVAAFLP